jgi:Ca2+-binding RTX toxin-like protein
MTLLRASMAFDDTRINFNLAYAGADLILAQGTPAETFHQHGGWYVSGITVRQMARFDRAYYEDLSVQSAAGHVTASSSNLTFDGAGLISGGKVQMIHVALTSGPSWQMVGTNIAGAAYTAALTSADAADDRALVAAALAGNDRILLSNHADQVHAGGGRDLVMGMAGNDTLYGEGGADIVDGGKGNDLLYGGAGNDQLYGGAGRDSLDGGQGDDFLFALDGLSDLLTGGEGHDYFVLAFNFGSASSIVTDFVHGTDHIAIEASVNGHDASFADLTIRKTAQGAMVKLEDPLSHVVLKMLLQGVDAATLTAADFAPLSDAPFQHSVAAFWDNWVYWAN